MSMQSALRRARQVVAVAINPHIPADRFDWVGDDGAVVTDLLVEAKETIELLLSVRDVLHTGRIRDLPARRSVSEAALNAALAMFVEDVALVRRDAVDAGVLTRSADGSSYRLDTNPARNGAHLP